MNKVSKELKELAKFIDGNDDLGFHPDWVDDLNDYAELIERLVKASEDLSRYDLVMLQELKDALAAIKGEVKGGIAWHS